MGQAKQKGASRQARAQAAIAQGRIKPAPNTSSRSRDSIVLASALGAVAAMTVRTVSSLVGVPHGGRISRLRDKVEMP